MYFCALLKKTITIKFINQMKNTFNWMFAAILLCGLTVSSCKKPEPQPEPQPEPEKQTVLTGMNATDMPFYNNVTCSYEYDAQYRIVRTRAVVDDDNYVINDYHFTYSQGRIDIEGTESERPVTSFCLLDSEGRITHIETTNVANDSTTIFSQRDYTYSSEGRLESETLQSETRSGKEQSVQKIVWNGDEIVGIDIAGGAVVVDFETSDAPAQALFDRMGYNVYFPELCAQGCFGKLPAHMPSKKTLTTNVPGLDPIVRVVSYAYTVDQDRLATCGETNEFTNETTHFTFRWEER